jgi:hypothetical protein
MSKLLRHIAALALLSFLLVPLSAHAQELPPDLIVRLRDSADAGISNISVIARDASGHELVRASTDASGRATFARLPVSEVRVAVQGSLPNGKPLSLPGQDAPGIRLLLDSPPVQLDLRAEADGLVRPDPATMIAPEVGVPIEIVLPAQTAGAATPRPTPSATSLPSLNIVASSEPGTSNSFSWPGLFLLIFLAGAATLVILLARRGRAV